MFPISFVHDIPVIMQWWTVFLIMGIVALPLTTNLFSSFIDKGYLFGKIITLTLLSYIVFVLGVLHILPFSSQSIIGIGVVFGLFSLWQMKDRLFWQDIKVYIPLYLAEEIIFLLCLSAWAYIRGTLPDLHGLEKFMDFGFVNAILRSDYFPPKDMWFTPEGINYYYFGHLMTAVVTKLSYVSSAVGYNLMLATLFAFSFSLSFSLGVNFLFHTFEKQQKEKHILLCVIGGIFSAVFVSLSGNLHTLYTFFSAYKSDHPVPPTSLMLSFATFPNGYWYPNATRFIYNTIHEFPLYSFVVSDLHGHVLDIPIVLTLVALISNMFFIKKVKKSIVLTIGFLIAIAYMTNVWDSLIHFLLTVITLFVLFIKTKSWKETLFTTGFWATSILGIFFLFSLPFSYFFKPFASGIGVLCAPEVLVNIGKIGPFLFEADHCQHSPLWQLLILYGFFYFWVISFFTYLTATRKVKDTDILIFSFIATSTILILIPEFIYVKDIYPAHYRANTMFKLVYQSFILLSLSAGYIYIRILSGTKQHFHTWKERLFLFLFVVSSIYLVTLVCIYPYFAITSYYGKTLQYQQLDGTTYLKTLYPDDYNAIRWINNTIKKHPVILEAQGDSYTDFARVSANTGLPTVLGWTVHEWLWRGTYDIPAPRIEEIKTLYESADKEKTNQLLKKYTVVYVFIGTLERQKYMVNEEKFRELGTVVYKSGETRIYKLN